jgi:deoxyxylulose-5-phosphate synthase
VLRQSPQDKVTVIGAGVTLQEALKSADRLKAEGTAVRVIDLYCVKPIDGKELAMENAATGGGLITVEDHWAERGIGEAALSALAQASAAPAKSQLIAVREMPHSGKPDELVDAFGISARYIVEAVRNFIASLAGRLDVLDRARRGGRSTYFGTSLATSLGGWDSSKGCLAKQKQQPEGSQLNQKV